MTSWVDDMASCIEGGKLLLETSFEIVANFSFVEDEIQKVMAQGVTSVFVDGCRKHYEHSVEGLVVGGCNEIDKIIFDEYRGSSGVYAVKIYHKYILPENFRFSGCLSDSMMLSSVPEVIYEILKTIFLLNDLLIVLVPASTNLKINDRGEWKRVHQGGGSFPPVFPCAQSNIENILSMSPALSEKIEKSMTIEGNQRLARKNKRLIDLYYTGLRFEKNRFFFDAFLNYYKVVELLAKDDRFVERYVKKFQKPSVFSGLVKNANQKMQMLFVWEYRDSLDGSRNEVELERYLELADKRNRLSHSGDTELGAEALILIRAIANFLLRHLVLD